MISSAPSSTFLRPSFQASTTRMEYCSIASGCVVGTSSTASCAPLRAWKSASFCSSSACWPAVSVPVRSVTRVSRGGMDCRVCERAAGTAASTARRAAAQSRRTVRISTCAATGPPPGGGRGRRGAEIHRRCVRNLRFVLDAEVLLERILEQHRRQIARERADQYVVVFDSADVAVARDRDPVLSALELCLQVTEVRVGLELRVVLGHRNQALSAALSCPAQPGISGTRPDRSRAPGSPGSCRPSRVPRSRRSAPSAPAQRSP